MPRLVLNLISMLVAVTLLVALVGLAALVSVGEGGSSAPSGSRP
jgi:hypothetical protein